jgi:ribosome-associated toxin RatA of RatAB toxin-antitoxin module
VTEPDKTAEQFDTATADDSNIELELAFNDNDSQPVEVVVEKIADRQRQITAKVPISRPPELVWKILTNYEALPDFIPNLAKSKLLEHPTGGIRVEQIGSQRLLNFNFSARVVLDLEEEFPKQINFQMVEGDLKQFSGTWQLHPFAIGEKTGTNLAYSIFVLPKRTMPVGIIEKRLSNDLRVNLLAIRQRAEEIDIP